jgi:hypothetical protein
MSTFLRQFIDSFQKPNQSANAPGGPPNQSVDPNAGQPNQSVDPSAGQPNQSVDPNAGQPNQSVDLSANQPGKPNPKAKPADDQKKQEELKKQKQAYDNALAALQPKLMPATQSKYLKLQPLQVDMVAVQNQMEAAAKKQDFVQALKLENDLSAKVDAYTQALAELEQQKQEYEKALAAIKPKLTEASQSRYGKFLPKQQEIATVQEEMEKSAQSEEFGLALESLNDLSGKLDAYLADLAEVETQRKAYEDALKPVTAKVNEVLKKQYLNLVPLQVEISAIQKQMEGNAQAGDFDKALQVVPYLKTKAEAYLTAATKEVAPPILGSAQSDRADKLLKKMSPADQQKVSTLMGEAKSEPEKQFLLKGIAAGHSVQELQDFAKKIKGKDAAWMRDNLGLTGSSTGTGVEQQWSQSCNATTVQAVKGQMDPLYALKTHEDNPHVDQADNTDGMKTNPKLAQEQSDMLTSAYTGSVAGGTAGVAAPRSGGGSGRWADDLLNNVSDTTGVKYTTKQLGGTTTVNTAMTAIDNGVSKGQPVPIVIGNSSTSYTHYVLVTGSDAGPPKKYTIHDPWSGTTVVRTEDELKTGKINLAGSNQISAYEEPATKEVP